MPDVMRTRRAQLGMSQAQLAAASGIDVRQVRRYEAGEQQPTLPVAVALARGLRITVGELAGEAARGVDLSGDWFACWQTFKDGAEVINVHEVHCSQRGDVIEVMATTRGTAVEGGGYLWRGELRLWDNEILMGWYAATEQAVRSKGTMYFQMHQHGQRATGRWVGLSYDGPVITGLGVLARTEAEALEEMQRLLSEKRGV